MLPKFTPITIAKNATMVFALALLLSPAFVQAAECRPAEWIAAAYPADGRFEMIDPCVTIAGPVQVVWQEDPELGGEYHIDLWVDVGDGKGWVDTELPDPSDYAALPSIFDWRGNTATVTGALVIDRRYGWRSLKPAWAVAGYSSVLRVYNEQLPDGSWREVTAWTDGHYTASPILPSDYHAAGIE